MSQKKTQLFNPLNGNVNVTGVVTASSFSGDGSSLTGIAATDNINTATPVNVLNNVRITGFTTAGAVSASNLNVSGVTTFSGNLTGVAATFSGNVTIGGTLTYQDVEHIDSVGIITSQQGIQVLANGLDITGIATFKNDIKLGDNDQIHLGADEDLDIYHSGVHAFVENGTGNLYLRSSTGTSINIEPVAGEASILANANGDVELYHNGNKKLETDVGGVIITGVCTATSFVGSGENLTNLPASGDANDITACLFI
tara:strand:- start:769 stop:1536 length:768 start_codon:yes stop_codon:yes gene_type:complete